jgi:putative FmdB family regulatory protein
MFGDWTRRSLVLPLYEYKCVKCGHRFERIESVGASETKKCPECGGKAERQLAAPAIQFKGSGWYVTDYGGKNSAAGSAETASEGGASKAAEKPADSKTSSEKSGKAGSPKKK